MLIKDFNVSVYKKSVVYLRETLNYEYLSLKTKNRHIILSEITMMCLCRFNCVIWFFIP